MIYRLLFKLLILLITPYSIASEVNKGETTNHISNNSKTIIDFVTKIYYKSYANERKRIGGIDYELKNWEVVRLKEKAEDMTEFKLENIDISILNIKLINYIYCLYLKETNNSALAMNNALDKLSELAEISPETYNLNLMINILYQFEDLHQSEKKISIQMAMEMTFHLLVKIKDHNKYIDTSIISYMFKKYILSNEDNFSFQTIDQILNQYEKLPLDYPLINLKVAYESLPKKFSSPKQKFDYIISNPKYSMLPFIYDKYKIIYNDLEIAKVKTNDFLQLLPTDLSIKSLTTIFESKMNEHQDIGYVIDSIIEEFGTNSCHLCIWPYGNFYFKRDYFLDLDPEYLTLSKELSSSKVKVKFNTQQLVLNR